MKSLLQSGAAVVLVLTALAGCAGGSGTGTAGGGSQIVMARVKDAVVLDAAHATDGLSLLVTQSVLENVVQFKPGTFDVMGALATKWTTSADGKTWGFTLRPNVKFTDGTPADAAAIKFNFDRWRLRGNPAHGSFSYGYWVSQFGGYSDDAKAPGIVRDVRADSPAHVTFVLNAPSGTFLRNLTMPAFGVGSPAAIKADPKAYELKPVGSGPYAVAEWVKDDHITLSANPSYNGTLAKASIASVVIRDIPDQATSVLSLQKGDLDMLTDPRPDDAKAFASDAKVRVVRQPPNNLAYIAMNVERKPFDNVLVRRAVAMALDIPAIVKGLYAPGTTAGDNWIPNGMLGENKAVKIWPYNVAQAKKLLAEAGFPNGFSTKLYLPTSPRPYMPEPQRLAEAIQANLKQAGITVELEPLEFGVFLSKVRNGEHPICLIGWTGDNGDPDNFYYPLLDRDSAVKGDAQNYSFWRDPQFHALMLAGQRSTDEAKRRAIYQRVETLVHDQVPAISLVHTAVPIVMKSSLSGFVASPDLQYHFESIKAGT